MAMYEEVDAGHDRVEKRTCRQLPVTAWISEAVVITFLGNGVADGSQGPDISTIPAIALKRVEVLRDGDAAEGGSVEARWGQFYEGDGEEKVAIIRLSCLNLARLHPKKNSMRGKLKQAAWSDARRAEILFWQAVIREYLPV